MFAFIRSMLVARPPAARIGRALGQPVVRPYLVPISGFRR
jgi:hypothetical protein